MEDQNSINLQNYNSGETQFIKKPQAGYNLPSTTIGQKKRELIYIFWFESMGTFVLTFATYASNNNGFVVACIYGVLLMLAQNQKCTFNPAISFMLGLKDKATWITVAILSQLLGAILAGLIGYFMFSNEYVFHYMLRIQDSAYLSALPNNSMLANSIGEVLGSCILTIGIIFQYDELLDYTNNRLEHSVIIASIYAFGRALTYKSQSSLNPAIALSIEFFLSCKDGGWGRFIYIWVFVGGPLLGAFLANIFVQGVYRPCFEKQIKLGLKF